MNARALLLAAAAFLPASAAPRMHAYAPPAIPHAVDPETACTSCHGREIQGGIPAIPHRVEGWCRSCHVAGDTAKDARSGLSPLRARGKRAYPGAPPSIPHPVFMRENCKACHGRERHKGMRANPHPEPADCRSCHLE